MTTLPTAQQATDLGFRIKSVATEMSRHSSASLLPGNGTYAMGDHERTQRYKNDTVEESEKHRILHVPMHHAMPLARGRHLGNLAENGAAFSRRHSFVRHRQAPVGSNNSLRNHT